jgi:hypothetical protein
MNRRALLARAAAALGVLSVLLRFVRVAFAETAPARRVRPSDPAWPSDASWAKLNEAVGRRLIKVNSRLNACREAPDAAACGDLFTELKNPYYIGDNVALTQSAGWLDAWESRPSVYAVAAEKTDDVVAAVNFARDNNLRLVVKGGGHSIWNAADSLLVWTRPMNSIVLHDSFVGAGCSAAQAPQPAVTIEAGAMWVDVYDVVTTKVGRYVQGGGCVTVGVAGLVQGGGFGSFSKNYGTAASWRSRDRHDRRRGAHRQYLYKSRPLLGDQGRRRRQLWHRHQAHPQNARAPGLVRRHAADDQGDIGHRVQVAARAVFQFLQRQPFQSALG